MADQEKGVGDGAPTLGDLEDSGMQNGQEEPCLRLGSVEGGVAACVLESLLW